MGTGGCVYRGKSDGTREIKPSAGLAETIRSISATLTPVERRKTVIAAVRELMGETGRRRLVAIEALRDACTETPSFKKATVR